MRRAVDVGVAAAGLVVLSPLALATAIAIRATMGGPVLFHQRRTGRGGEEFTIVKFRTMRAPRHPGESDADRTTRLGRWLRAASLDELPQLLNVLRGDMSLIGPRPTLPEQVARYGDRERGRLAIRPGITGWAQVNGRNSVTWPERIELDLWYIDHRSWRLDATIVWRTVRQLVTRDGIDGPGGQNYDYPAAD